MERARREGAVADPETTRGPFRRIAYVLGVTAFGAGIPTPLYAVYQHQYGLSPTGLALIFASYTAGVLLTMFFLAPQADILGTRPILFAGMLLTVISALVFLAARSAEDLAVARFVSGLAVGATTSTATVAMTHREPRGDTHHVARVAVAANFGAVAAGVLLASLAVAYLPDPSQVVFPVLIVAALLGALALWMTPPHLLPGRGPAGWRIERISVPASVRGPFWIAVGGIVACYAIYGFFASLAPEALRSAVRVSAAEGASIVAVMFGAAALVQLFLSRIRDRNALLIGLPILVLSLALFVLALPLASAPLVIFAGAAMGIGVGYVYMGSVTLIDRVAPEVRGGEILAGFYLAGYLALAGPTLGLSLVADRLGLVASGLAFGATMVAVAGLTYLALLRTPLPPGGEGHPMASRRRPLPAEG